ncbi:hypothetical protein BDV40DRAFT_230251 [Aspergillus tamarii]|uniref:Uncharacterized protein n=1 Tax=Aspergillus tamarii TaxID=41984 RepID=A0A5N6UN17_ASPTM|nr:hypothetical protein BDV40DRAFT_230251 [Aspergillus tamarii]
MDNKPTCGNAGYTPALSMSPDAYDCFWMVPCSKLTLRFYSVSFNIVLVSVFSTITIL